MEPHTDMNYYTDSGNSAPSWNYYNVGRPIENISNEQFPASSYYNSAAQISDALCANRGNEVSNEPTPNSYSLMDNALNVEKISPEKTLNSTTIVDPQPKADTSVDSVSCPNPKKTVRKTATTSTAQERTKMLDKRATKSRHSGTKSQSRLTDHGSITPRKTKTPPDPFAQWYQMMSQYYSQFYPGYSPSQAQSISGGDQPTSRSSARSVYSRGRTDSVLPQRPAMLPQPQTGQTLPMIPPFNPSNPIEYAYYYQYYYGPAAAQFWASGLPGYGELGRRTPKLFTMPHIKASLSIPGILVQVLPNRPFDGELPLVELIDLSELAHQAVSEATKRASEVGTASSQLQELSLHRDESSSGTSGLESPDRLSSLQAGATGEEEEARAYNAIAVAWDRSGHTLYPGPLDRYSTLKADVLAFLRDKLSEIQDRLPVDWESATLLITYLEWMVKNNGVVQPSDLVSLLLEGHLPYSVQYRTQDNPMRFDGSNLVSSRITSLRESFSSLPASELSSGRQSPYALIESDIEPLQRSSKAASECGGYMGSDGVLVNRGQVSGSRVTGQNAMRLGDKILDRFRELLMHGLTMKALDHACRAQLWGHAFTLARHMGPEVFEKVMEKFLTRAIPPSDPILTFYQLSAGQIPQAVTNAAYGRSTDIGEWRPHLAMILAAYSAQPDLALLALERLGDGLLSRRLIYAAQLCYLLMGPLNDQAANSRPRYRLPNKIWLIGIPLSDAQNQSPFTASTEAIQLTEIYEYAMKLANEDYRLPQLLPFKLIYATRLIDAGLLNKANRYLCAMSSDLLLEADALNVFGLSEPPPVLYSLVENCLRLVEPLQSHPEVDELELSQGRIGRRESSSTFNSVAQLRDLYTELNKKLNRSFYDVCNLDIRRDSQPTPQPKLEEPSVAEPSTVPPIGRIPDQPSLNYVHQHSMEPNSTQHLPSSNFNTQPQKPMSFTEQHSVAGVPLQFNQPFSTSSPLRGNWNETPSSNNPNTPTNPVFHRDRSHLDSEPPLPVQTTGSTNRAQSYDYPSTQPASYSGATSSSDIVHTQNPTTTIDGGHSFFIPNFVSPSDASQPSTPQPFDYFAGSQYQPAPMAGNRSRTTSGSSHASLMGIHTPTTPNQPPADVRSRNSSGVYSRRDSGSLERHATPTRHTSQLNRPERQERIKEEPDPDEGRTPKTEVEQQSKDGWFSGLLGKLKRTGAKNVYLPDDKNPSIVWDDQLKQWIDVTNPEASHVPTPPPPPTMPTGADSNPNSDSSGRAGNRSRYVNVLANQAYGSAASKVTGGPIQPPLPPTMYSPLAKEHQN